MGLSLDNTIILLDYEWLEFPEDSFKRLFYEVIDGKFLNMFILIFGSIVITHRQRSITRKKKNSLKNFRFLELFWKL